MNRITEPVTLQELYIQASIVEGNTYAFDSLSYRIADILMTIDPREHRSWSYPKFNDGLKRRVYEIRSLCRRVEHALGTKLPSVRVEIDLLEDMLRDLLRLHEELREMIINCPDFKDYKGDRDTEIEDGLLIYLNLIVSRLRIILRG